MSEVRNWRKARVMDAPAHRHVRKWLRSGLDDFRANLGISLCYGLGAVIAVWSVLGILILTGLGWLILPLCAGAMMLWPVMTVGLYKIAAGEGETPRTAAGQIFLASVIMMFLVLLWIRSATLLFAVFFGLRPFDGFAESLITIFSTPLGLLFILVGSAVGGIFASFAFAISAFSFPMLIHREIDSFSAMGLSFSAVTQNIALTVMWAVVLTGLCAAAFLSGFLLMIPLFPVLGYATWHAYFDLFESD